MKTILQILLLLSTTLVNSQEVKTTDFFNQIKNYDVSNLWVADKIQIELDTNLVDRIEPIGYIGDNYQRFYIHYISGIQNPTNKHQYLLFGKTRVKNNVCDFQGKILITESRTYNQSDVPGYKQGYIKGTYEFFEDSKQKGTGVLQGTFTSHFFIDNNNLLKYDALMFGADGFNNNQFKGMWTSYKTGNSKKCNWGDGRIPDSDGLDLGAGEFGPAEKYLKYGWENYSLAWGYSPNKPEVQEARKKENEKWWIEKE